MRRREFITLLGGAAAAWPVAARAQQPGKLPTIGILGHGTPSTRSQWIAAFVQRLRELGWIEGRTVAIEYRWAEGRNERFAEIAAEFVRLKVDVIVTTGAAQSCSKAGDIGHPDRLRVGGGPGRRRPGRQTWRGRAATSPACRSRRPILPARNSNFCARLSPVCAGWQSWPILAIPAPCWRWAKHRQRRVGSGLRSPHRKSGEPKISRLSSRRSRVARTHFMSVADPLVSNNRDSNQYLGARRCDCRRFTIGSTSKRVV